MEVNVLEDWRDRTAAIAAVCCKGVDMPCSSIERSIRQDCIVHYTNHSAFDVTTILKFALHLRITTPFNIATPFKAWKRRSIAMGFSPTNVKS